MKCHFFFIFIMSALLFNSCTKEGKQDHRTDQTAAAESYTCPMHPSVISDRPGACPVCGMALVKQSSRKEATEKELQSLQHISLSQTQRVITNIATQRVERRSIERQITAVGVVDFAEPLQVTVSSRFRGRIERLHVNYTGEVVGKGQPLFDMYSPDLITAEQDLILSLEALEKSTRTGEEANARVQRELAEAARTRLRVHFGMTEEQVGAIEKNKKFLNKVTFHSPMHGTVLRKQVQEGQYVDEGTMLYQLADLSRVWIYLEVYEKEVRFLNVGQRLQVTTEAYPGESFSGRVTFIDPVMNGESRTVRIRAEFANPGGKLKPNMYVKASIGLAIRDAIIIPGSAVLSTGKRNIVWIETGTNSFEPREVTLGTTTDVEAEVLSGLREGESIVITGGYLLDSESQLQQPVAKGTTGGEVGSEDRNQGSGIGDRESGGRGLEKKMVGGVQEIKILVEHSYAPEVIRVQVGKPVRLLFHRNEDSRCTDEVIFKDFGIRQKLPAFKTTAVEFTPKKRGTFDFSCGMEMIYGKVVVGK